MIMAMPKNTFQARDYIALQKQTQIKHVMPLISCNVPRQLLIGIKIELLKRAATLSF